LILQGQIVDVVALFGLIIRYYANKDIVSLEAKRAIAFHMQHTLCKLRQRLDDRDAWRQDALLLTLIFLVATSVSCIPQEGIHRSLTD
jgi:hypothetical protein